MSETLIWGLRREHYVQRFQKPQSPSQFSRRRRCTFLRAVSVALCALGVFAIAGPRKIASDYISKSLSDDMLDPMARYRSKRGSGFWVAVSGSGEVIGTVALEPANEIPEHGWTWIYGDGELRRMSVFPNGAAEASRRRSSRRCSTRRATTTTGASCCRRRRSRRRRAPSRTRGWASCASTPTSLVSAHLRANFFAFAVDGSTLTPAMLHDDDDAGEFRLLAILRHLFAPTYRGSSS